MGGGQDWSLALAGRTRLQNVCAAVEGHGYHGLVYNHFVSLLDNLRLTLEMIKWEHSVFALPFALCGALLAANGLPTLHQLAWIMVAMVAARSAAMAFN